jgi:choline dehydrogenase-like flavoprotein
MSKELPKQARVVIIGGGVVGCSVAYHLTKLGWKDVVLLERKQLTCGTTWHAAGLVGQLRATMNLTRLAQYTTGLYETLEEETGQATGFMQRGSIGLALHDERMEELKRGASMAKTFGLEVETVGPDEIKSMWPLVNTAGVVGGVFLPKDGQCNPTDTTQALAKGARMGGAQIFENVKVTGVLTKDGRAVGVRRADQRWPRRRRHHRPGQHRGGVHCELRRHVGPRAGPFGRGQHAAARLRAFLHRHRADCGVDQQAAGHARARRMRLLQRRCRQTAAGRLRAGGQALGHGRHPRGFLFR